MLKCDDSFKTILLGSITVNSKEIDTKLLKSAQEECKRTQQRLSVGPPKERLRCSLELADAKNLTGDEHFRVVYQCYNDLPNKWEEETFKTGNNNYTYEYLAILIMPISDGYLILFTMGNVITVLMIYRKIPNIEVLGL